MNTIQFRLVPDEKFPMFSRLEWDVVGVSFREVIEQGVHPWAGDNQHYDLVDAFLGRFNGESHVPSGLRDHYLSHAVDAGVWLHWMKNTKLEQAIERIQQGILFCEPGLNFSELAEIAGRKLNEQWSSGLALTLAQRVCPAFSELRAFLKGKDETVKLRGRADLEDYDWSRVLSLGDFAGHGRALEHLTFDMSYLGVYA